MEAWIPVVLEVLKLITGLIGHEKTLSLLEALRVNAEADEAERLKFGKTSDV